MSTQGSQRVPLVFGCHENDLKKMFLSIIATPVVLGLQLF